MSAEPRFAASPHYAHAQLVQALQKATQAGDAAAVRRSRAKVARWQAVIEGMASGALSVGTRTPVAGTPPWVTLEVAPGGFATGRYLAEAPLRDDELAHLGTLPEGIPGATDREKLNLWYLSDGGQAELRAALSAERYVVDVPEDAALLVVTWLLDNGHYESALDLVAELRAWMDRLRMSPRLVPSSRPTAAVVRLESVGTVKRAIRETRGRPQIVAMMETLRVWHPLYDRLVALWCDTIDGDLPHLSDGVSQPNRRALASVDGGWPCRVWPADWAERRQQWLNDYQSSSRTHRMAHGHEHPKSNFSRLRAALEACEHDSGGLSARDVGWIRRALANTITKHGAPGSETRAALRTMQASIAARPTHPSFAEVVASRLDRYPEDGGVPEVDPIAADVTADDAGGVPAGHPIPARLVAKATRALEAPIDELVARGVIGSGEVLARVLPQITAQVHAANLSDPQLAQLHAQTYAAFRRRRSLLLLNLEHQIQLEELPWISVLTPLRSQSEGSKGNARKALRQATLVTLDAFPYAILPNPLIRELGALANQAQVPMPLVEEVAADIFMGTFTTKWRRAALITSESMAGNLYARYFDLPGARTWSRSRRWVFARSTRRWGKETAEDFAAMCAARATEARVGESASYVAANGAVLEQSQILTTHNLAVLVEALQLHDRMGQLAPDLADRALAWAVRRQGQRVPTTHSNLIMIKSVAYAWRQAIFFLSYCDQDTQLAAIARLRDRVERSEVSTRFSLAVDGLAHIAAGGRFNTTGGINGRAGKRFLGWSVGQHWCLDDQAASTRTATH